MKTKKYQTSALVVSLLLTCAGLLCVLSCAETNGGGDGKGAEGLSDLLGEAAKTASVLGHDNTARRIGILRKASAAEALKNPETREAKAIAIGQTLSLQFVANVGPAVRDDQLQKYVNLVCTAVAKQTPRFRQTFYCGVLKNATPTGVALPGGYVFVTTGLLRELKNESELACILAHEIAHVVHEDGLNMYERQLRTGAWADVARETGKKGKKFVERYGALFDEVFVNGYSRQQEIAADKASVQYAYDAGYNPEGLLSFMRRAAERPGLNHEAGKQHPSPRERISALERELNGVRPYDKMPKLADRYRRMVIDRLSK